VRPIEQALDLALVCLAALAVVIITTGKR